MPTLVQWHISEQNALTGYWKLVFAGVIDNQSFTVETTIKKIDDKWLIMAYFWYLTRQLKEGTENIWRWKWDDFRYKYDYKYLLLYSYDNLCSCPNWLERNYEIFHQSGIKRFFVNYDSYTDSFYNNIIDYSTGLR